MINAILGRLGRRFWLARASRAIGRAHEQGLIDSWLMHELHARIETGRPDRAYPARPRP
jgi:hypothetical protein